MLKQFDAQLLGGNSDCDVSWWHDYIRNLLDEAHEFYTSQVTHRISAVWWPQRGEVELTWRDLETDEEAFLIAKVDDEQGEQIASTVSLCSYHNAINMQDNSNGATIKKGKVSDANTSMEK